MKNLDTGAIIHGVSSSGANGSDDGDASLNVLFYLEKGNYRLFAGASASASGSSGFGGANASAAEAGASASLIGVQAVPEPASLALFGIAGVGGLVFARRRKQKQR